MTDRECLECIKNVISTFGFVLVIVDKPKTIKENNIRKTIRCYEYFIDLDNCIIDIYNKKLFDYIENLIDIVTYDE